MEVSCNWGQVLRCKVAERCAVGLVLGIYFAGYD